MFKFFRAVRLKLLENGRLKNYTLYAIGEIVLVVVGILIALQINNWNEGRKNSKKEELILQEMLAALTYDSLSMESYLMRIDVSSKASKNLLAFPEYNDSLVKDFINSIASVVLVPKIAAFEQLKSTGLDIIKNDSLRQMIVTYYDVTSKNVQEKLKANLGEYNANVMLPFFYEHFKFEACDSSLSDLKYIPKSYPELISNPDYFSILVFKYIYNEQEKIGLLVLQKDIHALLATIRRELDVRN